MWIKKKITKYKAIGKKTDTIILDKLYIAQKNNIVFIISRIRSTKIDKKRDIISVDIQQSVYKVILKEEKKELPIKCKLVSQN